MTIRQTHTYAELELSQAAYNEIKRKLEDAGYQHAFMEDGAIDMHGIGVTRQQEQLCEDEGCPHHGTPHVCISHDDVGSGP